MTWLSPPYSTLTVRGVRHSSAFATPTMRSSSFAVVTLNDSRRPAGVGESRVTVIVTGAVGREFNLTVNCFASPFSTSCTLVGCMVRPKESTSRIVTVGTLTMTPSYPTDASDEAETVMLRSRLPYAKPPSESTVTVIV